MSTREVVLSILLMAFLFLSSQSEVATGHQESSMCGLSKVDHSRLRIIGGRLAEDGEFPWHAAMFRIYKSSDVPPIYICGASIIDTHWLLTAAHCVHRQRAKNIQVGIGSKSLKGAKMVQVVKILSHPDYNPVTYENDIALLKVSKPLEISNVGFINHICLPGEVELDTKKAEEIQEEAEFFGNKRATVAGFGFKDRHTEEEELMAVDVQVFNRSYCLKQYQTKFRKHMICAGSLKGGQDSCQGDSGGSLIRRINGQAVIVGVVSWGVGCGRKDFPGVYTDVNNYVKWIKSATGQPKRNSKQLSNNIESHDFGKPDELTLPPLPTLQVSHLDNECLGSHNYLRALHYAPKLKTDPQLVKIAKRISSQLLNMNKLEFRKFHKFGQNIARYYGREPSCKEVVQFWYGDGRSYDYNRPGYSPKTGTFTQIVWKSSKRLGCAKAKGNGNNFGVVCLYDPPGNMRRHFEENVQPPFSYQENNL